MVWTCCSNTGEDTIAGYYSGIKGTLANGPTVINGTALGRTRNAVFSNVALFMYATSFQQVLSKGEICESFQWGSKEQNVQDVISLCLCLYHRIAVHAYYHNACFPWLRV